MRRARDTGFKGAVCPHASWIKACNEGFRPSPEETAYYVKVREVFAEGLKRGMASVPIDGKMIDVPVDVRARLYLEWAGRAKARDEEKARAHEEGTMNNRVSRCAMFVTPTNPRFIDKAWTRGGDVYILDIEDSIAPGGERALPDADPRIDTEGEQGRRLDLREDQQAVRGHRSPVCRVARRRQDHAAEDANRRRRCGTRTRSF